MAIQNAWRTMAHVALAGMVRAGVPDTVATVLLKITQISSA